MSRAILILLGCLALIGAGAAGGYALGKQRPGAPPDTKETRWRVVETYPTAPQLELQHICQKTDDCWYALLRFEDQWSVQLRRASMIDGQEDVEHESFLTSKAQADGLHVGDTISNDERYEYQGLHSPDSEQIDVKGEDDAIKIMRQLVKEENAWGSLTQWQVRADGNYMDRVGNEKPLPK